MLEKKFDRGFGSDNVGHAERTEAGILSEEQRSPLVLSKGVLRKEQARNCPQARGPCFPRTGGAGSSEELQQAILRREQGTDQGTAETEKGIKISGSNLIDNGARDRPKRVAPRRVKIQDRGFR